MPGYGSDSDNPNYTESVASLTRKTKEDLRLDQLIPSEILVDSGPTGIKQLLEHYYKFMNMDEFLYSEDEIHTDTILSGRAVFRIPDPNNENNTFYTDETGADSSLIIALDEVNPSTGNKTDIVPLSAVNISITNGNELPGSLRDSTSEVGKTLTVSGLGDVEYSSATLSANVTLTDPEDEDSGTITELTGHLGFGYPQEGDTDFSAIPTITISAPTSGTTATATATLYSTLDNNQNWGGLVITITNAGTGYTKTNPPTVTVTANSRAGTTAIFRNAMVATLTTPIQYWVGPGPSYILNAIEEAMNIDENTTDYLELMQKEIAAAIPRKLTVNKRSLYKNITDFYKLKGSQDSVEVFFRLLFNESVEVDYPWDKTLIPSEGAWDEDEDHPAGGRYLNNKGFLSDTIKLQDSYFYQKFSYLIRTGKNLSDWSAAFERLVHPAGFIFFGEILLLTQLTRAALGDNDRISSYTIGIEPNITTNDGDGDIQVEGLLDTNGNPVTGVMYRYKDVYGRTNRKTLSSMPGLQPGVIGLEDLMVLVEAFASTFLPNFVTRINKSAVLSTNVGNGEIEGVTILHKGWGYTTPPTTANSGLTVQSSSGSGAAIVTTTDENGSIDTVTVLKEVTAGTITAGGSGYLSAPTVTFSAPSISGTTATGTATIATGSATAIAITAAGTNYSSAPTISFSAPAAQQFNGSNSSVVSTSNNNVTLSATQAASWAANDSITYTTTGTAIAGLTSGTTYFVKTKTGNAISLSATSGGSEINITGVGVGTTHRFTGQVPTATAIISSMGSGFTSAYVLVTAAPNAGKIQNIYLSNLADKIYHHAPVLTIAAPTSVDADGVLLSTNVTATATVTLDGEGEISGITINNPGNGYVKDPVIRVSSPTSSEGRGKDVDETVILSLNHPLRQEVGTWESGFKTIELNDYHGRKENSYYALKKFRDNYPMSFFSDNIIGNTYKTSINSYNVKTIINQE